MPVQNLGSLIGKDGRNLRLLNHLLSPGRVAVNDNVVEVVGDMNDSRWRANAIRMIRSAHRGGILKWLNNWEREKFNRPGYQKWLESVRIVERQTKCSVVQTLMEYQGETHEVWMVLENEKKGSDLASAIQSIGTCIHRRYKHRSWKRS